MTLRLPAESTTRLNPRLELTNTLTVSVCLPLALLACRSVAPWGRWAYSARMNPYIHLLETITDADRESLRIVLRPLDIGGALAGILQCGKIDVDELVVLKQALVLEAHVVGNRVARIFDALEQLKRLSELTFHHALPSPEVTNRWFEESGFGVDQHGFVHPAADAHCNSILSFAWGRDFTSNNPPQARLFAVNNMGPDVHTIRDRLDGVAWCYYRDALNGTLVYPKLEIHNVIPSDFDWRTYHPYLTVEPGVNPDRRICWTAPNIDYGGEGLITIASIPVYIKDHFVGLWSIECPHYWHLWRSIGISESRWVIFYSYVTVMGQLCSHPSLHHQNDRSK